MEVYKPIIKKFLGKDVRIVTIGYDEYIVGLANTSSGNRVGLYENHYDCSFKRALEILAEKIHDCNNGRS